MKVYIVIPADTSDGLYGLSVFSTNVKAKKEIEMLCEDLGDISDWTIETLTLDQSHFVDDSEN